MNCRFLMIECVRLPSNGFPRPSFMGPLVSRLFVKSKERRDIEKTAFHCHVYTHEKPVDLRLTTGPCKDNTVEDVFEGWKHCISQGLSTVDWHSRGAGSFVVFSSSGLPNPRDFESFPYNHVAF